MGVLTVGVGGGVCLAYHCQLMLGFWGENIVHDMFNHTVKMNEVGDVSSN